MTVLRREEAPSMCANLETGVSCRIGQARISPVVPALVRHFGFSNWVHDQAVLAEAG